jgi:hypothetical protein
MTDEQTLTLPDRKSQTETPLPDRASMESDSPYYYPFNKKVGVKFDGIVIFDAVEYCVSEGWVRRYCRTSRGAASRRARQVRLPHSPRRRRAVSPMSAPIMVIVAFLHFGAAINEAVAGHDPEAALLLSFFLGDCALIWMVAR